MSDADNIVGTPSGLNIETDDGRLLVRQGEIITFSVIEDARREGLLDQLLLAASMVQAPPDIEPAAEYVEIGDEEPEGVHPRSA